MCELSSRRRLSSNASNQGLANINKRPVSDDAFNDLPEVKLPDGSKVQTSKVGALVQHIRMYDRTCNGEVVKGMYKVCYMLLHKVADPVQACQRGTSRQ